MADAPKTDAQIINDAYQDQIKRLFGVLYDSMATHGLDPKDAAQKFANQITQLQTVKNAALNAMPKPAPLTMSAKVTTKRRKP